MEHMLSNLKYEVFTWKGKFLSHLSLNIHAPPLYS